ncbi:MAG: hypothetical protein QM800_06200 [Paludibacter sp.]
MKKIGFLLFIFFALQVSTSYAGNVIQEEPADRAAKLLLQLFFARKSSSAQKLFV